ncbi:MAG: hypothetical protein C4541_02700 [Candidatus Auribacter fodinae]|jgi:ABC-type Fe3+-citrate transport system substrate-binding protein|uniref:Uncharacterized protein n=1 Tax=Candidatus Auribacter fodinae TaxID=2093366 RepID=A0A3A4R7V5_9BACT|nr:MAG: hypothetical protein C4541_02700 [Candidatus Auribacter fodinae]
MKHFFSVVGVVLALGIMLSGCGEKKAASGKEAIDISKTKGSVEQQVDYLVGQAKAFQKSEEYQEAINVAQYIIANLEKESDEAKKIIEQAKNDLAEKAKETAGAVSDKLKNIGK